MAHVFKNPSQSANHSPLINQHTATPSTALAALKLYEAKVNQFLEHQKQLNEKPPSSASASRSDTRKKTELVLSTTDIMKLARSRLMQMNSKDADVFSIIATSFGDIQAEEFEDMEIAITLQAAAEKVAYKKFNCAKKLLTFCSHTAFKTGSPVQRCVFHFAKALKERIDRQMGGMSLEDILREKPEKPIDVKQTQFSLEPATIAHQQQFNVVAIIHFTGMQCILDNVASAKKIHLIDFRIRNGWHWTTVMQALAERCDVPIELVKITAVGTDKYMMEETGKRLSLFAKSMDLPFSFHTVVSELKDLRKDMFYIRADETVAIFSSVCLFSLSALPCRLDSLMRVIKSLKPSVVVVNEVDQSTDSPEFIERFTKSLFFISAMYDYVSVCSSKGSYRKFAEEVHIWEVIKNIVVAEGTDRVYRHQKLSFWRALFMKFGFNETRMSSAALCQAKLMVDNSPGNNFYNLGIDGKCMTIGWKGTPLEFLSVWKFSTFERKHY